MGLIHSLKNLFFKNRKPIIEAKYFEKYRDVINRDTVLQLLEEYKSGDIIFEPIRNQLSEAEQEDLYAQIDKTDILSRQDKIETIIGLMMILDGSFPESSILSRLEKVFGKEFVESVEKKREEFKTEIAIKKLTRFVKLKFNRRKNIGY